MAFFKRKVKGGDDEVGTSVTEAAGSNDGAAVMTDGETKEQKKDSDDNGGDKKKGLFGKRPINRKGKDIQDSVRLTSAKATSADPQDEQQVSTYDGLRQAVEPEVSRLGPAGRLIVYWMSGRLLASTVQVSYMYVRCST